jgi:hypothetical protein
MLGYASSWGFFMAMYFFRTNGAATGFLFGSLIYDLDGEPLGRIIGSRVHRLNGSYVGEWFHQMVVARPAALPRDLPTISPPPRLPALVDPGARRSVAEYHLYPDAFDSLRAGGESPALQAAA